MSLGPSKLTSALVPLTPSLGSIFKNSFPKDLSVEIVCARGYFEKIPRPKPPLAGAGLGLGRTLGGLGARRQTSDKPGASCSATASRHGSRSAEALRPAGAVRVSRPWPCRRNRTGDARTRQCRARVPAVRIRYGPGVLPYRMEPQVGQVAVAPVGVSAVGA